MAYTTFNQNQTNALIEPMFLGEHVNVARYDEQKFNVFERLIEKQLSFFWRPEEVDLSRDSIDFKGLSEAQKHIFISNLKYQSLLDSVQGRSPNVALLPLVSIPELETWIETWSFSETIHSRSYTHILRNLYNDPRAVFEDITRNPEIVKRAKDVSKYYDHLIKLTQAFHLHVACTHMIGNKNLLVNKTVIKEALYLCICSVNALEAIRFYVSFACTFAFSEAKLMEGNGKIMRLIARDEALHKVGTNAILNFWRTGMDDPEMVEIAERLKPQATKIFIDAVEQEKEWADYLFSKGSMLGLNKEILSSYIEYIADMNLTAIGLESPYKVSGNPLPWMDQYLLSDNVQVAPQESEKSDYLVGAIDAAVNADEFNDFSDL